MNTLSRPHPGSQAEGSMGDPCPVKAAKMLERLAREVEQMREASVVDLSKLFPRRDERQRVEETW